MQIDYDYFYKIAKNSYEKNNICHLFRTPEQEKSLQMAIALLDVSRTKPKNIDAAIRYYKKYNGGYGADKYKALCFIKTISKIREQL